LFGDEAASRQIAHQRLVDGAGGKIEIVEVLGQRQFGDRHLIFDGARLFFGDLGGEKIAGDLRRLMLALDRPGHDLVVGGAQMLRVTSAE
jgi:hypothetical protein